MRSAAGVPRQNVIPRGLFLGMIRGGCPMRLFCTAFCIILVGCSLVRSPILDDAGRDVGDEADGGMDAPGLDAADDVGDGGGLLDVFDAPLDTPPDVPVCVPSGDDVTCDGADDDCDGNVDEGAAGLDSACLLLSTRCVAVTAGGVTYQSCPPLRGDRAWSGTCATIGRGYELAVIDDPPSQAALVAALGGVARTEAHWVGVNDFESQGVYVWRDRVPHVEVSGLITGSTSDATACAVFRPNDGRYEERDCASTERVLCRSYPATCAASESPVCNGIDDNCDGRTDEGCSTCATTTFWDHVYYNCPEVVTFADAATRCAGLSASLATIEHYTEYTVLGARYTTWTWIGLTQATGAGMPTSGWSWSGSPSTFGITPSSPPWGGGEPNDAGGGENGAEDCARARSNGFYDYPCEMTSAYLCERPFG